MNTREWLSERVSRLRAQAAVPQPAPVRSTHERLKARLRQGEEALSPRALRQKLDELKGIVDPLVSEVEGGRRAGELIAWYASASPAHRRDLWLLMSERFVADPEQVKAAQQKYAAAVGTPDEAAAEVLYRRATVSPRRRLLQRFSAHPDGIPFLVNLRAEMQPQLKTDKRLLALDVEMEYMFSTWFDVGFLELRRISWDSPASLVEKLIKYEAVHDIRSWGDVKNRLDSDRRCYGFFHPRLPGEPLIFVEVALINEIAPSITPLLDEAAAPADLDRATTAIFYSISNTQAGLRGVSFGDSLIKRVVECLHEEFPRLKTFATLSPIPGLRAWLGKHAPAELLQAWEAAPDLAEKSPPLVALKQWAARYLAQELQDGKPLDAVARFHLGNGARVERLNWAADPSPKGLKQSYGLMVNYLYDLKKLDRNRSALAQGKIPVAPAIKDLLA
ncbi:malonyl-CoA decarboxylase domain-containing protein [Hydrogenophaga pseudoflava]|uniref:Malonyl-CoA decarboxylase (MCD) n=1 Tax=Hydrogenophaga pseudoflava TaxID=47421 RepID=A0A4V1ABS7_HYDPS|nr:malonyl-CoA decarboxylase family protein [Hydrogenophaga pseudoflava]QBM29003.1 Malonyl-CoA decarboxylase (MCD) [Hydrogenophaga pseudoflava]